MTGLAEATWLESDDSCFRENFDSRPFTLTHRLAEVELFSMERILELARVLSHVPGAVYYDAGDIGIGQRFDEMSFVESPIDEVIERVETARAWILLRKSNTVPAYASVLESCLEQIYTMSSRDLRSIATFPNMTIVISSPERLTPFHIDGDCNFLLQLRGSKAVHLFDRNDRDVLPEEEIERYYAVDKNAATYKPDLENRALVVELLPGDGVHIPVNTPHWVANGPSVSVSVSINFFYNDAFRGDVYRANYWLRRLGLRPLPPQRNDAVDGVKRALYGSARTLRDVRRRGLRNLNSRNRSSGANS